MWNTTCLKIAQILYVASTCSTSTNVLLWWRHFRTPIESILSLYTELLKVQHVKNGINLLILSTAVAPTWAPILVSHLLSESSCYQATSLSTTRSFGLYCLWFTLIQSGWNCRGVNEAFDIFPVELGNGPVVNLSVSLHMKTHSYGEEIRVWKGKTHRWLVTLIGTNLCKVLNIIACRKFIPPVCREVHWQWELTQQCSELITRETPPLELCQTRLRVGCSSHPHSATLPNEYEIGN